MIRVPDAGRFELRLLDGATNPYLAQAGILAAGLDGVARKLDPGQPLHINMYTEGHTIKSAKKLPATLLDALRLFEKNKELTHLLGDEFAASYIKLKMQEWRDYTGHLSDWERRATLDC
jgi:glutamine synthetase